MKRTVTSKGFTLTELAVVLAIIALLIGTVMFPLTAQLDMRDNGAAQKTMGDIRDALIGYAASHGAPNRPYLPCPDTDGDGIEQPRDVGGTCPSAEGDIPWNTLGLGQTDPWNNRYRYRVTLAFSNSTGFTLTTLGTLQLCTDSTCGTTVATAVPAVILTKGKNGAGANANEVENSNDDNSFIGKEPDPNYDDLVIWLSPNILFNRMIAAGRLP